MILTAHPGWTATDAVPPAGMYPVIFRRAGPRQSSARTAYPSIAELSQNGRGHGAATSSARVLPSARPVSTRSVPTGATLSSTMFLASS